MVGAYTRGEPKDWRAVVLADRSVRGASPDGWARAALAAMEEFGAERLVAEVNQGGDLVRGVIQQVDPLVPFREVRATRSKMLRAEPVAAFQVVIVGAPVDADGTDGLEGAGQP